MSDVKIVKLKTDNIHADKHDKKKKQKKVEPVPEPEPIPESDSDSETESEPVTSEEEEQNSSSSDDSGSDSSEENDDQQDDNSELSISTTDILSSDPLYFILSQFFLTPDQKSIATILEEINQKLGKLADGK